MKLNRVLAAVLLISFACFADDLINRQSILAESEKVTTKTYPNADEVVLDDYTQVRYNPDGTAIAVCEGYTKILTEKSKRSNQSLSYNFTIPYTEISVDLVEIIKPNGESIKIDVASQGREMTDRSQMSSNIYNPNDKVFQVSITGLEINDVLHTLVTTKTVKTRMLNSWSDYQVFEHTSPIKHLTYEVYAPKSKPIDSLALKDELPLSVVYTTKETPENLIHKWTVSDVDMIYPEPDMPAYWTAVQRLLVSTNPDWPTVSRWYWELSKPHLDADDDMKAKVQELISGIDDKNQQMRAIFKFVSQDIRYLGITIEKEAPGYEPHDATMTFANRHGVCRDKAALLVAMLRAADFEAYPVLIYSGPKKDEEVPQPYFNHAISAVRSDDGQFILMDSTDESTQRLLPAYLNDCSYLVATPEGSSLLVSSIEPAENNMMLIETTGEVSTDGSYKAKSTLRFEGINDNAYRGFFLRNSPEQRRQYFEAVVKRLLPGATLTDFKLKPEDLQNTEETITAEISYQADNVLIDNGQTAVAAIYNIGAKVGMVNFVLGKTGLEERRFALETRFACGVREQYTLKLPDDLEVISLPQYDDIEDNQVIWKRLITQEGNIVKGESEFKIKTVRFKPQEYLALKSHLADIEYNDARKLILNKIEKSPDAIVEYEDKHYSLTDKNNWKTSVRLRVEVLTYKGKKDLSELKFDFNPAWENIQIIYAQVETGGEIKEISEEEINIMDAAWAGSAPRYPAGKTIVASLPGVEIGSVIEYEIEMISENKPFFATTEVFGNYYPIKRKSIQLTLPKDLECEIFIDQNGLLLPDNDEQSLSSQKPAITTSQWNAATTKSYEWKCENIEAVERETSQAPFEGICPVLKISTGSWQKYTSQIKEIISHFEMTREARMYPRKADELVQFAATKADEIIRVRDFIAENIRPVGARFTKMPLTSLTKPDITMINGYGNYMDRAILMMNMLQSLDIEASIILASESSRVELFENYTISLADVNTFTKALVKAVADGKTYYLGDTDQYGVLGATAADKYLSITLDDATIERINVDDDMISRIDNHYKLKVDADGTLSMKADEYSYGIYHGFSNKKYSEMPPEQTRRYYQELIGQISQSAHDDGGLFTEFKEYPGSEKYSLIMNRYAVVDGDFLYLELPPIIPDVPDIREDDRKTPYYNGGYMRYRTTVNIQLPDGFEPILLPIEGKQTLPADGGTIEIKATIGPGNVELIYDVNIKPAVAMPNDCNELSEIFSWLKNRDKKFIMLKRSEN